LIFVLVAASALVLAGQSEPRSARIECKKFGFSIAPPIGWLAATGSDSLPLFVNFPWKRLQAQAILPNGGATINFVVWDEVTRRHGDETLTGWAELDEVVAIPDTIVSRGMKLPQSTMISEAFLVSFDLRTYSSSEQRQREVSAYWSFRGRRFAAHLFHVVDDPNAGEYVRALTSVLRSVRPL
jgi:hypothetical protein